ncbi:MULTISPECIES: HNH endonuclease [Vibrio]|uniref:HNH endonuclease 5 domain-containing protein n=1 Tax=Vibrio syngnathi TaxID=3034029 RepID=A0AA34TRG5_9VIBR|nr:MULTISPECIES: HNH endonuclease [Vibrio]CAK2396707.1 HNH endonuclease 5 domain-containing protein [Vibrio crassostreae]ARP38903.1 hypothetical protein K08M4_21700 [Vibrio syngnathi]NAZ95818.1 HNH endonuclease [Vibrio toranzoniae]PMK56901.1 hypothetical protein BCT96_18575 [Vibrio splendidus]CAK3923870.1 HNH endonuclease 5 domain-containing protein [Vibrio crassostreae]
MTIKCALCTCDITEANNTKEHVIPNALGGRKKITNFICNQCNRESGSNWDVELANQLNPLGLLFGISRERGVVPSEAFETTSGSKIILNHDGTKSLPKPEFKEDVTDSGVRIQIRARNMKEAEGMFNGVKRKYSHLTVEPEIQESTEYLAEPINFSLSFGGLEAGRALVKSTLALAVEAGVDFNDCAAARDYLLNDDAEPCFGYFYSSDPIVNRPKGIPLHCIYVKGVPETNMLLGYVEFYGHKRMLVCLSDSYTGSSFENIYALNPIDGKEIELTIDLQVSRQDVRDCYDYKLIPNGSIENALNEIMPTAIRNNFEKEKDRAINVAVQYAFQNCGAEYGDELTDEQHNKFLGLLQEKLMPFFISQIRR